MGATTDLDVTTAEMLAQLEVDLIDRGVSLALAQARGQVRDRLERTGLLMAIGEERIHLSMSVAVGMEGPRALVSDVVPAEPQPEAKSPPS